MPDLLTHLALAMIMFCAITPMPDNDPYGKCLPDGIKPETIVTVERVKSTGSPTTRKVTVSDVLATLRARCKKGKLVDRKGREIYFYRLIGCWGNPPADYQELLENQKTELTRLIKKYTVIELTCSSDVDPRRIS